jgi:hypothetical protein
MSIFHHRPEKIIATIGNREGKPPFGIGPHLLERFLSREIDFDEDVGDALTTTEINPPCDSFPVCRSKKV